MAKEVQGRTKYLRMHSPGSMAGSSFRTKSLVLHVLMRSTLRLRTQAKY